jgi:hypothetical protein
MGDDEDYEPSITLLYLAEYGLNLLVVYNESGLFAIVIWSKLS